MGFDRTDGYLGSYGKNTTTYGNRGYADYLHDRTLLPFFFILFLISPMLALLSAMFNFRKQGARMIILLFMGAYGYTFILNPGMDAYNTAQAFSEYYRFISPSEFLNDLWIMANLGKTASTSDEPYMAILSYIIVQFTFDKNIFMMFVAFIFGIGYVKGISLIYEEREGSWNFASLLLFILFISWIGIVGVNHPRNYTGGCIFFVGAYLFIKNQEYKYLFIVFLAPLIHFMYLAVTIPFFVYVIFKEFNLKYVYLAILVLSFVASAELPVLESLLTTTELGEDKVGDYTGSPRWDPDAAPSAFEKEQSFHSQYYRTAGNWTVKTLFIFAIIFMGYFTGKYHDRLQAGLGSVAILTLSLSNFTQAIPTLSGRTMTYFGLFAIAYLVRLFSKKDVELKAHRWIIYLFSPAIFLYIFTMHSRAGDFMDFKVLLSPLLYPFLGDDPVSIKEFIKTILDF